MQVSGLQNPDRRFSASFGPAPSLSTGCFTLGDHLKSGLTVITSKPANGRRHGHSCSTLPAAAQASNHSGGVSISKSKKRLNQPKICCPSPAAPVCSCRNQTVRGNRADQKRPTSWVSTLWCTKMEKTSDPG